MTRAEETKARRIRVGTTKTVLVPAEILGLILLRVSDEHYDLVANAIGDEVASAAIDVATNGLYKRPGTGKSLANAERIPLNSCLIDG